MTRKRVWVLARVCAGVATLSAEPSAVAQPHEHFLDFRCGGQGRTADERIEACNKVIASGGGTVLSLGQAFGLRANHLATEREYDRAIEDYNRAIELDPRGTAAFSNRGLVYVAKGDDDRAIQDFDAQIHLEPRYTTAFYQRGMIWTRRQEFDRAIGDFDEVIRLYHSPGGDEMCCSRFLMMAVYRRGQARLALRDFDRAIADFSQAIDISPSVAAFYADRGEAHRLKGDYLRSFRDEAMAAIFRRWGRQLRKDD